MSDRRHYILAMRDDRAWLIGPFFAHAEAAAWAHANNSADDPRWQTIELSDVQVAMSLPRFAPDGDMERMARCAGEQLSVAEPTGSATAVIDTPRPASAITWPDGHLPRPLIDGRLRGYSLFALVPHGDRGSYLALVLGRTGDWGTTAPVLEGLNGHTTAISFVDLSRLVILRVADRPALQVAVDELEPNWAFVWPSAAEADTP